jgi:hypothetical protein
MEHGGKVHSEERGNMSSLEHCVKINITQYSDWATDWKTGKSVFNASQRQEVFAFSMASRSALGLTQPVIQFGSWGFPSLVRRPVPEADHSTRAQSLRVLGSAYVFMLRCLIKLRADLVFYFFPFWRHVVA